MLHLKLIACYFKHLTYHRRGPAMRRVRQERRCRIDSGLDQELFLEMEAYERLGIAICIEDRPASPRQIASTCFLCEDTTYMRDYILEGDQVKEIRFCKLQPLTDTDRE